MTFNWSIEALAMLQAVKNEVNVAILEKADADRALTQLKQAEARLGIVRRSMQRSMRRLDLEEFPKGKAN